MITPILFRCLPVRWLNCLAVGGLLLACAVQGAEVDTTPVKFAAPRSVFADDPKTGKDPFFPSSARRLEKVPGPSGTQISVQAPNKNAFEHLQLKGILGNSSRRLALINNHTFEVGEQAEVKSLEGKLNIRCWEIRNRSVVVSFVGESQRKELFLNEK
ncbi:MAG: hypothetical protein ABI651_01310 [Verrucomicrobiota bacterium]